MTAAEPPAGAKKNFWTPYRLALTIVVLSLLATVGISSCNSNSSSSPAPVSETRPTNPNPVANSNPPPVRSQPVVPAPGPTLPSNVSDARLRSVNGAAIRLSDYAGKVMLVNLWATWCGPCRNETPELVKLYKEFQSQGVVMVGLSTEDPDSSADAVKDFVRTFGVDYRVGWATREVAVALMQGRDAIPQSFIISRDGHILKRFVGFNASSTPPLMRQAIVDAVHPEGPAAKSSPDSHQGH